MIRALLCSMLLAGCYAEFGLGYAGQISAHGSVGLVYHYGEHGKVGSIRAGAGGAIAGYTPSGVHTGVITPGPIVVGGHVGLAGTRDSLVIAADVHEPHLGAVRFSDPDEVVGPLTTRAFVGVGYRHSWIGLEPEEDGVRREEASVILALGPELYATGARVSARTVTADTTLGAAVSVVFTMRAALIEQMGSKMASKH